MRTIQSLIAGIASLAIAGSATSPVSAAVSIGGYAFDDTAFADTVDSVSGNYWVMSAASLTDAVTGSDPASFAKSLDTNSYLDVGFSDNLVFNGAGSDLVLFELGAPDAFQVTIDGITRSFQSIETGYRAGGYSLNAAAVDLDAFGFSVGKTVTSLRLTFAGVPGNNAAVAAIGGLNSIASPVPESATWAMFLVGFALTGSALRRRRPLAGSVA